LVKALSYILLKVFLIKACAFSELAKDYFQGKGYKVLGGIISPTHDNYAKKVSFL